ncbi:MAG: glycosyltransferase [Candidatus Omnitrophica bacterium]|nr:glycosyltransferase [Candidatus Omnitrophota bacterium]
MKILQINNCDTKGGAAKVAHRLCRGLMGRGHEVLYLVAKKHGSDNFVKEIEKPSVKLNSTFKKILYRLGLDMVTLNASFPFNMGRNFINDFDIIHIHDPMGGYFNLAGVAWLSRIKPLVWTMHTMWPFTGGCLYSYDCQRWKKNCGKCPQFGTFPIIGFSRDGSLPAINIKRLIYKHSAIFPVAVSQWLCSIARQSILRRFDIIKIQNPVDTRLFHPIDKNLAKAKLGIPANAKTIIFSVASKPEDKRKGIEIILKALPLLKTKNIFLLPLTITADSHKIEEALRPYPSLAASHIENEIELNTAYNAADILWHPSLADTSSLGILEAFAAGTPAVASRVGGVQEIVVDGENGFFVEPNNPEQLAEKTDILFSDDKKRRDMSKNACRKAISDYSIDIFLDKYEQLYKKIIEKKTKVRR